MRPVHGTLMDIALSSPLWVKVRTPHWRSYVRFRRVQTLVRENSVGQATPFCLARRSHRYAPLNHGSKKRGEVPRLRCTARSNDDQAGAGAGWFLGKGLS